jgi:hypothetical protein
MGSPVTSIRVTGLSLFDDDDGRQRENGSHGELEKSKETDP